MNKVRTQVLQILEKPYTMPVLFGLAALALGIASGIGRSVSIDEAAMTYRFRQTWSDLFPAVYNGPGGTFSIHYLFLKIWSFFGGDPAIETLRYHSAFAFAGASAIWANTVAYRFKRIDIVVVLSLFFCLSPALIYYGGEARWYAWLALLFELAIAMAIRGKWLATTAIATIAVTLHVPSLLWAFPLSVFGWRNRKSKLKTLLLISIQFVFLSIFVKQVTDTYWSIMLGSWYVDTFQWVWESIQFLFGPQLFLSAPIIFIAFRSYIRLRKSGELRALEQYFFLFAVLLPIPVALITGAVFRHNLGVRYFLFVIPAVLWGLGIFLSERSFRLQIRRFAIFVLIFAAFGQLFGARHGLFSASVKGTSAVDLNGLWEACSSQEKVMNYWDPFHLMYGRFYEYYWPQSHLASCSGWTGQYPVHRFLERVPPGYELNAKPLARPEAFFTNAGTSTIRIWFWQPVYSVRVMATRDIARFWVPDDWQNSPETIAITNRLRENGFIASIPVINGIMAEIQVPATAQGFCDALVAVNKPFLELNPYRGWEYFAYQLVQRLEEFDECNEQVDEVMDFVPRLKHPETWRWMERMAERE